ncbi:Arginine permease CAN1 [Penicillium verhagenii]|nr:Arginine permease CAN1 [Penicillium verhagenii]
MSVSSKPDTAKDAEKEEPARNLFSGAYNEADEENMPSAESITGPTLKRKLKSRHLQMIAIGGTIGTGLFISSGEALAHAGPIGALIAYIFIGSIVFSVMTSLGEIATYLPVSGAFTSYATRLIDPSLGFAMGWIYWFSWAITFALELTATSLIIQYWDPTINTAIFIAVFWVVITILNLLPVNFYGEIEFWLSTAKVLTVIGFILFGICIDAGAGVQGYLGFHNWVHPGPFVDYLVTPGPTAKFVGFWAVLIQAGFSCQGTELVGLAAGETENPRQTVPKAIRATFFRILLFYVFSIFFMGLLVPSDNPDLLSGSSNASASPFVIAAKLAGVKVLPGLINAVLLTVVLSAANSNVYSGSRMLVGLAADGYAPALFAKTTKGGVPYFAVVLTALFGLLGFMNISTSGTTVFNWLLNISTVAGFILWASLNACHIAFMRALKARNVSRFTAWIPSFSVQNFFVAYVSLILFAVLWIGHKLVFRDSLVSPLQADLDTGRAEIESEHWDVSVPTTWYGKIWFGING